MWVLLGAICPNAESGGGVLEEGTATEWDWW